MISIRPSKASKCVDKAMFCSVLSLQKDAAPVQKAVAAISVIRHQHSCMKTPLTQHRDMHMGCSYTETLILLVPDREQINIQHPLASPGQGLSPQMCSQLPFLPGLEQMMCARCCMDGHYGARGLTLIRMASMGEEEAERALHCLSPGAH